MATLATILDKCIGAAHLRRYIRFLVSCATFAGALGLLNVSLAYAGATSPCSGLGVQPVSIAPLMPNNFSALAKSQIGANCLAWQEFIYLNWQADPNSPGKPNPNAPAASFGTAGDTTPTVWESYLGASQVFNAPLKASSKKSSRNPWLAKRPQVKQLSRISKLGDAVIKLNGIAQADGNWLTAQSGGLTYYEVMLNQDEYAFITSNVFSGDDLTTFAGQAACAAQPGVGNLGGFNLPAGNNGGNKDTDCTGNPQTYGQNIGAIEIKAAWIALPPDGSINYRYKTAIASITDPSGKTTQATVGLVGLHIIHKLPGAAQFIWATFEQIDNSPDENNGNPIAPILPTNPNQKPRPGFSFYNALCTPNSDPVYQCQHNKAPGSPCTPGKPPTPGCYPYSAPMQVTRMTAVQSDANSVTGYAWSLMPAASVFNYYRLIDVQWPNQPTPVQPGTRVGNMPAGDITPRDATRIMANTTLETFVQSQLSCMDCHQGAPIAQASQQSKTLRAGRSARRVLIDATDTVGPKPFASDYSFVFSTETVR